MDAHWSVMICNYRYEVLSKISSTDFNPRISEGEYLASMLLAEDLPRLLDFIRLLNQGVPTFGHEMSILDSQGKCHLMQVGGFPTDEGQHIILYKNYLELYEELMCINNEQANLMRLKMKAAFTVPHEYEGLTSLNNELLNSQRELQKNKLMIEHLLEEKENLNQSLKESNQLKDQLLGVIGHDLRAPLGNIISYLDLISDVINKEQVDLELKQLSKSIKESSKQALKVLEDLIIWSKVTEKGIELQYTSFYLNEVIDNVIVLEQPNLTKKNVKILMNQLKSENAIWSDSNILSIIVRNILANAIKYSPVDGVIEIKSEINWDEFHKANVVIDIRDYGEGISKEVVERINNGYIGQSKRGTKGEKGSGIGLSITRQMVNLLGGTLKFNAHDNGGTTVTVAFQTIKRS